MNQNEITLEELLENEMRISLLSTNPCVKIHKEILRKIIEHMISKQSETISIKEIQYLFEKNRDMQCFVIGFISGFLYSRLDQTI